MSTVDQAIAGRTPLGADLKAGLDQLDLFQKITFTLYRRVVLPLDGYVFWVKASQVVPGALYNNMVFNRARYNQPTDLGDPATTLEVMGSLHYATDQRQEEDATYAVNRMIFSAQNPVVDFNRIGDNELYIGEFEDLKFAFAGRGRYYKQAKLHHYVGEAVTAPLSTQLVEDPRTFNTRQLIVSNSLPSWLALNAYAPAWPIPLPAPPFPLYPSYLMPTNLRPPFASVHVEPDGTAAWNAKPIMDGTSGTYTPARDRVTVTLYGVNNDLASAFLFNVLQYSLDANRFGILNMPAVLDDKRTQNELQVIAMKKRIMFEVNYYQAAQRDIARQMVEEALLSVTVGELPLPPDIGIPPTQTAI